MNDRLLLTVEQAAQRIGLGRSFTYMLMKQGRLPSIKIGAARRVLVSDLEEFVQRLRQEQADEGY